MAKVRLQVGAELDLLTKAEMGEVLTDRFAQEWNERARGIKVMRVTGVTTTISTTVAYPIEGPQQGYSWALRLLGVSPSASAGIRAWVAGDNGTAVPANGLVGAMAAASFSTTTWSGTQAVLNGGEYLALSASASCTTDFILYAVQVPTELLWKLV